MQNNPILIDKTTQVKREVTEYRYQNYIISVVDSDDATEFWLQHKLCGVKMFMFAYPLGAKYDNVKLIEGNLEGHIRHYQEQYEE